MAPTPTNGGIKIAPFEVLYERKCRLLVHWRLVGERATLGPNILLEIEEKM